MKNNNKKAFSLFEILIVLAIISVLTVMLMTLSKKGLENAYNNYYYASYIGIYDAIQYSYERSIDSAQEGKIDYYWVGRAMGFSKDDKGNKIQPKTISGSVTYPATNNGIKYTITSQTDSYKIEAVIPSANGNVTVQYYYYNNFNNGVLVPYKATIPNSSYEIKLYERADLLPFFLDDGVKGRGSIYIVEPEEDGDDITFDEYDENYKRSYSSFKVTYCKMKEKNSSITTLIENCTSSGSEEGVLRVANPRKVL